MLTSKSSWHSTVLDRKNREGIPKPTERKFHEIFDLDQICEQEGGIKIASARLPMTIGWIGDHSETLYGFDNSLVHNISSGYHPDSNTILVAQEGTSPNGLVSRFSKYYGKTATAVGQQLSLEESRESILKGMDDVQFRYNTNFSLGFILGLVDKMDPRYRNRMASELIDALKQRYLH